VIIVLSLIYYIMEKLRNHVWLIVLAIALVISSYVLSTSHMRITGDMYNNMSDRNTITVQWEWKVFVEPDIMYVDLWVESQSKRSQDAQQEVDESIATIKDILLTDGVVAKDIQSTNISLQTNYNRDSWKREFDWYIATHSLRIIFRDVYATWTTQTIDRLTTNVDWLMIQNVSFDLEDKTEAFSSARTHAVQKAKQKAQELTKETWMSLGRVVTLNEWYGYSPIPNPMVNTYSQSFDSSMWGWVEVWTSISAGQLQLVRTVNITYEIKE